MIRHYFLQNTNKCNVEFKQVVYKAIATLSKDNIVIKHKCIRQKNSSQIIGAIIWYKN